MQRLRSSGFHSVITVPNLKRKALNSWSVAQDTYFTTKDIFERNKVVFTISTSIASVATAWIGYSIRYVHQAKVEERLQSIENAMKNSHHIEHDEMKKIISRGNVSTAACIATAGTTLVLGYGLGFRGGIWYANRKFRKEQLKLLGQIMPHRFQFLKRPLARLRGRYGASKNSEALQNDTTSVPVKHTGLVNS
ncbi:hypothetical protein AQUCO_02800040v1 [Aquilegia coerulea]|uniref:Uncharacterized protein n=1 Tax=Aquilegia coerulea TaxID=218851 RepID=A0A2G5D3N6_AQUCA|nr:hypothetical protein AQUCO_02800040v1 [Aquilegia coerulea]